MINANLRAFARDLSDALTSRGAYLDIYNLLGVIEDVSAHINTGAALDGNVFAVLTDAKTMEYVLKGKKINAIKEVRVNLNLSLLEAKNLIEDSRIWGMYGGLTPPEPWSDYRDPDEPPF